MKFKDYIEKAFNKAVEEEGLCAALSKDFLTFGAIKYWFDEDDRFRWIPFDLEKHTYEDQEGVMICPAHG